MNDANPPAPLTRALLLLCVGIHAALWFLGDARQEAVVMAAALIPARLTGLVVGLDFGLPAPLTLVTHQFLHGGWFHLLMNMVFLAWVGRQVEWAVGAWKLLAIYLLGGVAGGLAQLLMTPDSVVPVVGASGSIAAVFAAYALLFAQMPEAPTRVLGLKLSAEMVRALRYGALWTGLQLLTAVAFDTPGAGGMGMGKIAIWSHIGGFAAGLAMAVPMMKRFVRPE